MSLFDRNYFEALFGGKTFPDGSPIIEIEEEFMEYQKANRLGNKQLYINGR